MEYNNENSSLDDIDQNFENNNDNNVNNNLSYQAIRKVN